MSRVARAYRLPYFASRGIHTASTCVQKACGRPPGAARDAPHGRRDARATRCTSPGFFMRRVDFTSWNESRHIRALASAAYGLRLAAEFEEEHLGVAVAQVEAQRAVVADEMSSIGFRDAGPFFFNSRRGRILG